MVFAATPQESPRFEVASVKPAQGGRPDARPVPGGLRYAATSVTLKRMIMDAYHVKFEQVTGGPRWIGADHFDVVAHAGRPATPDELRVMLQNLLADSFQLQFHRATREAPIYVLGVDKDGPKLTVSTAREESLEPRQDQPFHLRWTARAASMPLLAWRLSGALDRPVLDRTGLSGRYDFDLTYTAEAPPEVAGQFDLSGPTVFDSLRRQLGLRLDSQKGPVEVIVVDHAEKPKAF